METPLLATKLYIPPLGPTLVSRQRLVDVLNANLRPDVRLTLVSAPPGFGKTTLVLEWLQSVQRPAAWVSLDASDNDLVRFVNYLAAALTRVGLAVSFPVQIYSGTPYATQPEILLAGLLNEIATIEQPFILVLDDYHVIHTQPVHDAIAFLLERQPPQLHLVITSRTDPPLPLPRLRARRQVYELRTADLRFTPDETAELLRNAAGLDLSQADIDVIEHRTEGWVAALHMAALSLQGCTDVPGYIQTFSGEDRYLLDYLVEEVLHQQPEEIQTFVLQTSILDQLSAELCEVLVVERSELSAAGSHIFRSSREIIAYLDRSNLFVVPLDDKRRWYRYHRLFGDFLRARLAEQLPEAIPSLHRRAAEWYEENGWMSEAIRHVLDGQDYDHAARLIDVSWTKFFTRGEVATLTAWLARIPEQLVPKYPQLLIIRGWSNLLLLNFEVIEESIARAQHLLGVTQLPDHRRLNGSLEALRAFLAFFSGDMETSTALSYRALENLSPDDYMLRGMVLFNLGNSLLQNNQLLPAVEVFERAIPFNQKAGNLFIAIWAIHSLSMALIANGRLKEAERHLRHSLQLATKPDGHQMPVACKSHSGLAEIELQRNRLEFAEHHSREALRLGHLTGMDGLVGEGRIMLWIVLSMGKKHEEAQQHLAHAEALVMNMGYMESMHLVLRLKAQVALNLGDVEQAEAVLAQPFDIGLISVQERESRELLELDLRLAKLVFAAAGADIASLISDYQGHLSETYSSGQVLRRIGIQISLAQAYEIEGKRAQAVEMLESALAEAAPEEMVSLFYGPAVIPTLLRHIAEKGQNRGFARRVLAELWGNDDIPAQAGKADLIEPLSERELEVLHWMGRGLSGPEIAEQLSVAPSTIKTHTKNIFQKLNAHSRYEAVEKARQLKLI
jgi:LuxR family transcriptional regulator, maltose regulon positive regulatory protein